MNEIFLCSDLHVLHANIIKYCDRPFSDEYEMNLAMQQRWNITVSNDDVVIVVGDLSAGVGQRKHELAEWCRSVKGKKVLVRGNHDHQKDAFYLENGFLHVCDYLFLNGILWSHVPGVVSAEHPHPMAKQTIALQESKKPVLTIHGHEHRVGTPEHPGHFNCAADRHNFTPFTLASVLDRCGVGSLTESVYQSVFEWVESLATQ